jgi:hypothetical protein
MSGPSAYEVADLVVVLLQRQQSGQPLSDAQREFLDEQLMGGAK